MFVAVYKVLTMEGILEEDEGRAMGGAQGVNGRAELSCRV